MKKTTITITVTEATLDALTFLCKNLGLRKSQAIALAVNTVSMEKYGYIRKGESDEGK